MKIFRSLDEIDDIERTVVALGNFDGIHMGHRALITEAVRISAERGLKSAIFTFSNHPKNVMSGETVVKNILYEDEKVALIEELGIDYMFSPDFDETMMHISPEDFAGKLLRDKFKADIAICGFNFSYGYKAAGNAESLCEFGRKMGFETVVKEPVTVDGEIVSSTLIRKKITSGDVESAAMLMGRNYAIRGVVVYGNQLGRTIGFPTCNITIDDSMVSPANGVYVTYCHVDGKRRNSVTNVGNKPTIGNYSKNIETNILDFDENIYGSDVRIEFLKLMRTEEKFKGIEELQSQLRKDVKFARKYHKLP
ncbi:MAG: bifunctional riboflavin kinase/FAD synthetase [Anaerovoracaceae bacterium]